MSQRDRILKWLRGAGPRGVHSFEFYEARMPRGAAVIHALKRDGYEIDSTPETLGNGAKGTRYVLKSAVRGGEADGSPKPSSSTASPEQRAGADTVPAADPLPFVGFDAAIEVDGPTVTRSMSPYDCIEDAA